MSVHHIVVDESTDKTVGRIDLPYRTAFSVADGYDPRVVYLVSDEDYDRFYNLPVFTQVTTHGRC